MRCPFCREEIDDEDLDSLEDIGCPSCRRCFDLTDFIEEDAEPHEDIL